MKVTPPSTLTATATGCSPALLLLLLVVGGWKGGVVHSMPPPALPMRPSCTTVPNLHSGAVVAQDVVAFTDAPEKDTRVPPALVPLQGVSDRACAEGSSTILAEEGAPRGPHVPHPRHTW